MALNKLLAPLARHSLVRRDPAARTYTVHRLVQAMLRDELAAVQRQDPRDVGYEWLYRHLTGQAPTPPRKIGAIQPLPPRPRWVRPDPRNRSKMLEKVRKIWITGFLERSLFHETRILLGLSERPDAVARPLDLLVQRPDQGERPLPPGMQVVEVFDAMEQALLILGAPGSGKTTLLLELARDLLDRAEHDPTHPIPVVFPLSTWAESRRPLAEWLVDELNLRYDVPRKIGQAWVEADQSCHCSTGWTR